MYTGGFRIKYESPVCVLFYLKGTFSLKVKPPNMGKQNFSLGEPNVLERLKIR